MTKKRDVIMSCCWCCDGFEGGNSNDDNRHCGVVSDGGIIVRKEISDISSGSLPIVSGVSAMLSLVVITVAISTGEWLVTEEKLSRVSSNMSTEPDSKITYSGLWRVCVATSSQLKYECSKIDYFSNEQYSPDVNDSTMAIAYAVTKSAMFFFAATSLLIIAEIFYFIAHVTPKRRLCIFVAGVVFIVSGLLMLVGMVMYISIFKAEVGNKLRRSSSFQGPSFTYKYGFSFLLYVSGFITTEVAGTYAVFLYISWHQKELILKDSRHVNYGGIYHVDNQHVHRSNHTSFGHSGFLCERHQKRYFFSRDSVDHVDSDEFPAPPPPLTLNYHDYPRQFSRDITMQTVSTTADILQEEEVEYGSSVQDEFVTFVLQEPLPPPVPVRNSDWTFEVLRRTTPV